MKKPRVGRCIHCLRTGVELTDDHVFPRSWYPDNTPAVAKWKVPACRPCNVELGAIENTLRIRLSLCVDPESPVTAGLVTRAMRAIDPRTAEDEKEKKSRSQLLGSIRRDMIKAPPARSIIPAPGRTEVDALDEQVGVRTPGIRRVVEKIVRGLYFLDGGNFIEPPLSVDVYVMGARVESQFEDFFSAPRTVYEIEPGIRVERATPEDAPSWGIYSVEIWSMFKFWAVVSAGLQDPPTYPSYGSAWSPKR